MRQLFCITNKAQLFKKEKEVRLCLLFSCQKQQMSVVFFHDMEETYFFFFLYSYKPRKKELSVSYGYIK